MPTPNAPLRVLVASIIWTNIALVQAATAEPALQARAATDVLDRIIALGKRHTLQRVVLSLLARLSRAQLGSTEAGPAMRL